MAVIRESTNSDLANYVGTLALFCGISCTILMFRFRGFKATLNFSSGRKKNDSYDIGPTVSVVGAYRTHKEEFYGQGSLAEPTKILTPSMVKLPPSKQSEPVLKSSKSASDLISPKNLPPELRKSTPDVSTDPRGGTTINRDSTALQRNKKTNSKEEKRNSRKQEKEKKELEKRRLAEQRRDEKLAAQEQAKQDKLRIQRDRQIAQQQAREVKLRKEKEKKKAQAPQPQKANPLAQGPPQHSTNTLESSISRSSGPPPYSEMPKPQIEAVPNKNDNTGNTSFGKPVDAASSWDLVSEHRHQISRATPSSAAVTKQMKLDLQYSFQTAQKSDDNSEA